MNATHTLESPIQTMDDLDKKFLKSYVRSNIRFPQTRFYFILDFCGKLHSDDIPRLNGFDGLSATSVSADALVRLAQAQHRRRSVRKEPDVAEIARDISKTVAAMREFLDRCRVEEGMPAAALQSWIEQCRQLTAWIDASSLSREYLDFLSPRQPGVAGNVVRMVSPLAVAMQSAPRLGVLETLWQEIDKEVWVIR
ncbi:hypothetical protein PCO31110_04173 [Pandoraea communis]|uniref:Uncharacterized protein n=2 Tax=Burkholderiaceae TaxID=119060 RepID=A0A5E4XVD5_9BURK|nr:hypothetical protein AT395_17970 [Pandoraea apista]CFB61404.1 hypothetical protein LMG16407_01463 [Pandoraea apista]VVE40359.1 hypothetical protein PCO31110_04173 [Pandoraea communis]